MTLLTPSIVLNRARCDECLMVVVSRSVHDYRTCDCGNLSVDGGRDYLKRVGSGEWSEMSVITRVYERRGGLLVQAYQPDIVIYCTGPDGRLTRADAGGFVTYEPEGGAIGWPTEEFKARHTLVD